MHHPPGQGTHAARQAGEDVPEGTADLDLRFAVSGITAKVVTLEGEIAQLKRGLQSPRSML